MRSVLALALLLLSPVVVAQEMAAVPPMESPGSGMTGEADGRLGFGKYGEDWFLDLGIGTTLGFGKISFGVQAPLRIRVVDNDPDNDSWYRQEDWDDISDWTRILRFFQYGSPRDLFYIRLGELVSATIGHGTIVNRYYNTLDLDHYHTGIWTALNLEKGGVELMTNDILAWNLTATRGYFRPFAIFMEEPHALLKKLTFGTTFAADFTAPTRTGHLPFSPTGQTSPESAAKLETTGTAWFAGLDAELELFRSEMLGVMPYTDFNFAAQGAGWHLGLLNDFDFAKVNLDLRLEYRVLSALYSPSYFNTLYDVERKAFLPLPQFVDETVNPLVPKLWYYDEAEGLDFRHGFYGELFASLFGLVGLGGIYEDYQGPDNSSVTLRASLPAIAGIDLSAYYMKRNFDGFDELFDLDGAWLVAQGRASVFGPLYLFAIYSVYWQGAVDEEGFETLESIDSWQVGAGASFSF